MLARHSPKWLAEWKVFEQIEPFGDEWKQAAMIAWTVRSSNCKTTLEPEDFMPPRLRKPPKRKQTAEELLEIVTTKWV